MSKLMIIFISLYFLIEYSYISTDHQHELASLL